MNKLNSPHDEANDYLLGRLTPAARYEFEKQLAEDVALRQLVRELEEGLVALALTAPQLEVPVAAWANIQSAIARPSWRIYWQQLFQNQSFTQRLTLVGGVAAVMLLGAIWFYSLTMADPSNLANANNNFAVNHQANTSPKAHELGLVINALPGKNESLENPKPQLMLNVSKPTVAVAHSPKNDLQLIAPDVGNVPSNSRLSPQMQAAMLMAAAKQMGWTRNNLPTTGEIPVEVVDVANASDTAGTTMLAAGITDSGSLPFDEFALTDAGDLGVPIMALDSNLYAAIDPATLPPNSGSILIWEVGVQGGKIIGTVNVGDSPMIIDLLNANTFGHQNYYYFTLGLTNVIGQFPMP